MVSHLQGLDWRRLGAWVVTCIICCYPLLLVADDTEFKQFDEPNLDFGRSVWLGTCKNCHATGFASAPPVKKYAAWESRLKQELETLYQHALEGFYGVDYAYMPPRGGNDKLSDDEVKAAVDYMIALVKNIKQEIDK